MARLGEIERPSESLFVCSLLLGSREWRGKAIYPPWTGSLKADEKDIGKARRFRAVVTADWCLDISRRNVSGAVKATVGTPIPGSCVGSYAFSTAGAQLWVEDPKLRFILLSRRLRYIAS